jgi:phage tail sheath protein FI
MPQYLTPGVYVEEVPSTSKPIQGVATSVAAFVGLAPGGPVNTPMRISNWTQFVKLFSDPSNPDAGPFIEGAYLAHSVYGYFANGGGVAWVIRVGADEDERAGTPTARAVLPSASDAQLEAFRAVALGARDAGITVEVIDTSEPPKEDGGEVTQSFRVIVSSGDEREEHDGLTLRRGRTHFATKLNSASKLIKIEETGASLPDAQRAPAPGVYQLTAVANLPARREPTAEDFAGDVARRTGMGSLAAIDEVTMVCMPDLMTLVNGDDTRLRDVQGKIIAHCEAMQDRMAILDAPPETIPQDVLDWRLNAAGYDSKYATLYWPWIEVMDPLDKRPIMVPPSGHVAGVWARTDATRGVHKAPANEVVMAANGLAFQITHAEQGALNAQGINCIRSFPGRGIRIWGARTLSSDPEWRYLNVRRLFNYVTESIIEGTQWSVFEPNDERLWLRLRVAVGNFLTLTWRSGALFGASPGEAFYVKCDAETNPTDVIEAGQVVTEVGICPVKPAEFVIFRISQYSGGGGEAEVAE